MTGRSWTGGSSRAWRELRAAILKRDRYLCQLKLEGCTVTAPLAGGWKHAGQAHHLHGRSKGDDPAYLVAACRNCNLQVGDPTAGDPEPEAFDWTSVDNG